MRKADRKLKVFGASHHQYRSTPISNSSIDKFERDLGVELPRNYREFLLRVGYGCGPYYGIWSPTEILQEIETLKSDEYPTRSPSGKFPLKAAGIQEAEWPNDGCIPIVHQGCTYWTVLVLEGEFRGKVWSVACPEGIEGHWAPEDRPMGLLKDRNASKMELTPLSRPPEFLEWIKSWIESCKLDFSIR